VGKRRQEFENRIFFNNISFLNQMPVFLSGVLVSGTLENTGSLHFDRPYLTDGYGPTFIAISGTVTLDGAERSVWNDSFNINVNQIRRQPYRTAGYRHTRQ
jgi:hypothetical protein